eukprot:COSAG01_NODE_16016_length_1278_cov_1.611535_2_plen_117_part_00
MCRQVAEAIISSEPTGHLFADGDLIIKQGDHCDTREMFILSRGTVAIIKDGVEIVQLSAADKHVFGETALLQPDRERNASIKAIGEVYAWRPSLESLRKVCMVTPLLHSRSELVSS